MILVLVNFRHDNIQCGAVREEGICGKERGVEITRSGELLGLIPTCNSSRTRQRLIQETPLATSHLWWGSQDIRKADTKSTETRGAHSWRKERIWKYHTNLVLPRQTFNADYCFAYILYIKKTLPFGTLLDHIETIASLPCLAIFGPKRAFWDPPLHIMGGWQGPKLPETNLVLA